MKTHCNWASTTVFQKNSKFQVDRKPIFSRSSARTSPFLMRNCTVIWYGRTRDWLCQFLTTNLNASSLYFTWDDTLFLLLFLTTTRRQSSPLRQDLFCVAAFQVTALFTNLKAKRHFLSTSTTPNISVRGPIVRTFLLSLNPTSELVVLSYYIVQQPKLLWVKFSLREIGRIFSNEIRNFKLCQMAMLNWKKSS